MKRVFQILAVILMGFAAYFLWQNNMDSVFVAAVLAAVSFLLSIRFQIKVRLKEHEARNRDDILRK